MFALHIQVNEIKSVAVRYSDERKSVRNCTLKDLTGVIRISLWNQHTAIQIAEGQSVTFTGLKITQYGNQKQAQTAWNTTITVYLFQHFNIFNTCFIRSILHYIYCSTIYVNFFIYY
jgi:hypothetical protein